MLGPGQLYWSSAVTDSLDPPETDTVMPAAAMTVVRRGDDLVVQVMPSGTELDFFEVIADEMVDSRRPTRSSRWLRPRTGRGSRSTGSC